MATQVEIETKNAQALFIRATSLAMDVGHYERCSIKQLVALPSYVGFVEASIGPDRPFVMFLCHKDDGVALRLLWKREFEPASTHLWRVLIQKADTAIDVGGHTGIYSIIAAVCNPKISLYTLEPHDLNFGRLLLNLRANGLSPKGAFNVAASSADGDVPFNVTIGHYLSSGGMITSEDDTFTKRVQARRLDDFVSVTGHACVKIDTEGHELKVLDGMHQILQGRPDIILETLLTPDMAGFDEKLTTLGYSRYFIDDVGFQLRLIPSLQGTVQENGSGRCNVLLTGRSTTEIRELFEIARACRNQNLDEMLNEARRGCRDVH